VTGSSPEPMPDDDSAPASDEPPVAAGAVPAAEPKEDWETRFKYLLADFENFRRRASKDREAATRQARAALLRELLPLVEAFRAAVSAVSRLPPSDPVRQGFDLLDREWSTILKHEGVEAVASRGGPFRADEAEAVGEAPSGEETPDGTIVEVVQQGYRCFGGLLRPAKVIVARARASERGASPAASAAEPEAGS
jgi:molecular chaperone GrpE